MPDIITFGEVMLRFSPPHFKRFEQTAEFDICTGGGEYNVAVGAARLGLQSAFVTRLPNNPLGRIAVNKAREHGVDVSNIVWSNDSADRMGLYFCEFGAKPRASNVLYDRKYSAISAIQPGMVDWNKAFTGGKAYHVSGITPALSKSAAEVTKESMLKAKANGLVVSVDLNYRAKLWSEAEAQACMTDLMQYTDVLITTEEDTLRVFKIQGETYREVAKELQEKFGFAAVAITLRANPLVWKNDWSAITYADGTFYDAPTYEVEIVDRVGAGDSFSAGFLAGYITKNKDCDYATKLGVAYSALKHSIPGDVNWASKEEAEKLMHSGGNLRIAR